MVDKDKNNKESESMGIIGWILALAGLVVVVVLIYIKISVSGLLGFKF